MKSIVPVKLTQPNTRGALLRERLFDSIRTGCEKKIVWISGPAGSGKTTLAASYLDTHSIPSLWYQIDAGDNDLATFFYYLRLAIKILVPGNRKPIPLLTPEYLLGIPAFAKQFFEQISKRMMRLVRKLPDRGIGKPVVVFDNYHEIPDDSAFHEVLNAGLESICKEINVFILSRRAPHPAFTSPEMEGEMRCLGWDDIRLTSHESDAIAVLKARKELSQEMLSQLYQTTDGWAAGIVLFMESLRVADFPYNFSQFLPKQDIFAYFASELFDRTSPEIQEFLLQTNFLSNMNVRMAKALTNNLQAAHIFSDLNRNNFFTNKYSSKEQTFQYHPLFREFLFSKAERTMTPERLKNIKRMAARILEENRYEEDAFRLFCEAEEWQEALRILLMQAQAMIAQGRWQSLLGWIEFIPDFIAMDHPWLLYWKAVCLLPVSPDGSKNLFSNAFDRFRKDRDAAGSFLSLSGIIFAITYTFDSFAELDRFLPQMDEILAEHGGQIPSLEIEQHVVINMLNALSLRQPDNPSWNEWEKRAIALTKGRMDVNLLIPILIVLVFHHSSTGLLKNAAFILDSFHLKFDSGLNTPFTLILLRSAESMYHWLSGDFIKNRKAAEEAIALAESSGIHLYDVFLFGHATAGALSTGDCKKAEEYLHQMSSCLQKRPSAWSQSLYHIHMTWNCLIQRRFHHASFHAEHSLETHKASGSVITMANAHLAIAMVGYELRDIHQARMHLDELQKLYKSINLFQIEFAAMLLEARIAFYGHDEISGKAFLQKAMAIGSTHGYLNCLFWINATMADLCMKALEMGIERDYVRSLIRKRGLVHEEHSYQVEEWPWPVKIYTLGKFEMVRNDEIIRFSGKVQKKTLHLLKAIIAFGGKNVREEQLCDILWPDADGDLTHRSFETALYRLRRMIGHDNALKYSEGRLTLNRQLCWVDVFALEQILVETKKLFDPLQVNHRHSQSFPDTLTRAQHLTRKAIKLYKGHFLESEPEQNWLIASKTLLKTKYISSIELLAGYWEATGNQDLAMECYQKVLETGELPKENLPEF